MKKTTIIILALLLVAGFLYHRHQIRQIKRDRNQITDAYLASQSDNAGLQVTVTKLGDSLATARQIILDQKRAVELGIIEKEELKNKYLKSVSTIISLREQIKILNKPGSYDDPLFITVHDTVYIKLPVDIDFNDPWYDLNITAAEKPVLNCLSVYSQPTLTIGQQKKGLFRGPEMVTIYENANPYIEIKELESITIERDQKWYQTTWFKIGAGFVGGITFASWVK